MKMYFNDFFHFFFFQINLHIHYFYIKIINTSYTFHMHYLEYNSKANLLEKFMDFQKFFICMNLI